MRSYITGLNVQLSTSVRDHAQKKVIDPLNHFANRIRSVVVRLQDVDRSNLDSPRRAHAVVTMNNGAVLVVEEKRSSDFYTAVDMLGDRLSHAVHRHLERRKSRRRRHR